MDGMEPPCLSIDVLRFLEEKHVTIYDIVVGTFMDPKGKMPLGVETLLKKSPCLRRDRDLGGKDLCP